MTLDEVMQELESYGSEQTKKVYLRHGAQEPLFGIKYGDIRSVAKKIKKDHKLALKLFNTGQTDAMALAGLIADRDIITKKELQSWMKKAYWYMLSEYTVPGLAAESKYGEELGLEWIESCKDLVSSGGWVTLSNWISLKPDVELDFHLYRSLLQKVEQELHYSPNRTRYTMNNYVIAVGSYYEPLHEEASMVADKIGKVNVDMGKTSCKVPLASHYIQKVVTKGYVGKKRKKVR